MDLNPVRAGIAATPEESGFTSAQDRAVACRARRQLGAAPPDPTPEQASLIAEARAEARRDARLAPFGSAGGTPKPIQPDPGGGVGRTAADAIVLPPLLPGMSVEHYPEVLDWTGRQIRSDKRGHLSGHLRPALERLDLDVESWVENVERYDGLFYRVAGKLRRLREMAGATGRAWLQGHAGARQLYAHTG